MLARGLVTSGAVSSRPAGPGDVLCSGESYATLTTAGAGTILGSMIAAGILHRTGPGAGYTDTTDTAENILKALAGNDYAVNVLPGTTFRFLFRNTVAFLMTFAAGLGVIAGTGTLNVTASLVREYLLEVLNSTPTFTTLCSTAAASAIVTLLTPAAMGSITPGQLVSGTGITAGSRVAGVTIGSSVTRDNVDKITAITLDQNSASAQASTNLSFSPVIRFNGIRESTL